MTRRNSVRFVADLWQPCGGSVSAEPIFPDRVPIGMVRQALIAVYVLAMIAVIVGVDFAFLRGLFWLRLLINIAVVLAFAVFYRMFLRAT